MTSMAHLPRRSRPALDLDPTLDFLSLLWRIQHALQRTSKRMEATLGMTGPQRLVLKVVGQFPRLTASELARIVRLHPSTITGIVQRLEKKGLLTRERNARDQRRVHLTVGRHAKRMAGRSKGTVESAVEQALGCVSADRVDAAREVLSAIAEWLEA